MTQAKKRSVSSELLNSITKEERYRVETQMLLVAEMYDSLSALETKLIQSPGSYIKIASKKLKISRATLCKLLNMTRRELKNFFAGTISLNIKRALVLEYMFCVPAELLLSLDIRWSVEQIKKRHLIELDALVFEDVGRKEELRFALSKLFSQKSLQV